MVFKNIKNITNIIQFFSICYLPPNPKAISLFSIDLNIYKYLVLQIIFRLIMELKNKINLFYHYNFLHL